MRSCPDIRRIYVLVREQKGKAPNARFKHEIVNGKCFHLLRKQLG